MKQHEKDTMQQERSTILLQYFHNCNHPAQLAEKSEKLLKSDFKKAKVKLGEMINILDFNEIINLSILL